jgi:hypothetical protein
LNKKWFSDAARIFVTERTPDATLLAAPGIKVARPPIAQLLLMKLVAWRDETDQADAQRLLEELIKEQRERSHPPHREQIWLVMEPYISSEWQAQHIRPYFDDLWEER